MNNYLKYGKILNTTPYLFGVKDCSSGKILFESCKLEDVKSKAKQLISGNPFYYNYKIITGTFSKNFD
jgi:hypothetical protein